MDLCRKLTFAWWRGSLTKLGRHSVAYSSGGLACTVGLWLVSYPEALCFVASADLGVPW